MSLITIGMDAQITHKELERLVKKFLSPIKVKGWTATGLVISVDVAELKAEKYETHQFFRALDNQFVLVKREKWELNIQ